MMLSLQPVINAEEALGGLAPRAERRLSSPPMKGLFSRMLPAAFLLVATSLNAQQASSDASFVAPKPKKTKVESTTIEKAPAVDVTGVVKQAVDTKKAWELVNPLAPEKYGNGEDDVSWDPDNPDKPKGIILFGLQW
jgi:hypothetical protein